MKSTPYYDERADAFYADSVGADMSALYEPFLALLPAGGHVLDAGCGSGRDARAFLDRGYRVTAFDGSKEMAARASQLLGQPVLHLTFQALDREAEFDGVWACASLLHVPRAEMGDVLDRLTRALKPGGTLFLSFKYGDGEREQGGRFFNDYDEASFARLSAGHPALTPQKVWRTADARPGRAGESWLAALLLRAR